MCEQGVNGLGLGGQCIDRLGWPQSYVNGWAGLHWLEQTATPGPTWTSVASVSRQHYECKINSRVFSTHAIVRALNWWNELFYTLSETRVFGK